MSRSHALFVVTALLLVGGCSSDPADPGDTGAPATSSGSTTTGAGAGGAAPASVRGQRYCEIFLATASPPDVHIEVWNTFGLNDCPEALWAEVDVAAVAKAEGVSMAVLNGPRYWTLDEFVVGAFVDPTPRTLGGLEMRHAGDLDLPVAEASSMSAPYAPKTVARHTTFRFHAGRPVFELVDPEGAIYAMQSFSVQKVAQTEDGLAGLGATLKAPAGWAFRTRTLGEDLDVTAVDDRATVVADEHGNAYQRWRE